MSYCSKCGQKNDDEAEFCSKCEESLKGKPKKHEDQWDKRCEEECAGGKKGAPIFWGIIVIIIGLWIISEFVVKRIWPEYLPDWFNNFEFVWLIALIIAIAIIITGIRMIAKR